MANSSVIRKAKNKIVKEFIKNPEIIKAIDSKEISENQTEKYIGTHIFDYNQNPFTLQNVGTFITIQVQIPDTYFRSKPFIKPQVEIWIVSHERHMKVENIPKITSNRNDYISELIDNMFNGRTDFGIGEMVLITNIEGAYQNDYVYRKMIFEGTDFNQSVCVDK